MATKQEEEATSKRKLETVDSTENEDAQPNKRAKTNNDDNKEETKASTEDNKTDKKEKSQRVRTISQGTEPRLPKRKVALYIAYCGSAYQGMQLNPGANTIELHLQQALVKGGGIAAFNKDSLQKVKWQRCARTDKGVHAAGNVASLKMIIEPEGILERINANLPKDIRIFGFRRVTNSFDAKNQCDSRSYEYILPTFAFGPMAESQKREKKSDAVKSNDVADREAHIAATTEGKEMAIGSVTKADWKLDAEALARVRKLLAVYKGTHNFHNFTSGRKPNDPSSNRHILDFTCSDPYQYDGLEYVSLFVKGQSFMLHQIRKMIGTVVWIMRYDAPDHVLTALFAAPKVNIPLVPGLGLFLKKCHYEEYARGRGKDKDPLTFEAEEHVAKEFKEKFIYKHIVSKEQAENITTSWLNSLDLHFQHTDFEKIIKEAAEAPVVSFAKRKIFGTKKAQTRDKRPKKSWEVRRNQEKKKNNNNNSNSNGDTADSNSTKQKNNDNTSKSDSAAATTTTAATKPKETSEQS